MLHFFQNLFKSGVKYFLCGKFGVGFLQGVKDGEKFFVVTEGKVVRIAHGVYSTMYEERRAMD